MGLIKTFSCDKATKLLTSKITKKSQVALFIFLGMFILFAFVVIYYFVSKANVVVSAENIQEATALKGEKSVVENYIQSCLEKTTDESIETLTLQGGQSWLRVIRDAPTNISPYGDVVYPLYYQYGAINVPMYYVYNGINKTGNDFSPSDEELAAQLAIMIDRNMPYCLDGFKFILDQGNSVTFNSSTAEVSFLGQNKVRVKYSLNVAIGTSGADSQFTKLENTYEVYNDLKFFVNVNRILISEMMNATPIGTHDIGFKKNSFPIAVINQLTEDYGFQYSTIIDENSRVYLLLAKKSSIPRFAEVDAYSTFFSAYTFDWQSATNPYYSIMPSIPIAAENTYTLEAENQKYNIVHNASQWYWNVSSYCGPEFDYYTLYADTFKINGDLGIIYPGNLVPSIGPHDVLLEGIDSNDMDAKCIRKFRINVTNGDNSKLPFVPLNNDSSIRFGTAFYTYRGFNFYQLILATGTNNAKPLYFMVLPPALENMSCGGFLTLDVYTGELSGIVTAPPGNYTIEIGVVQLLSNVSMPYVAWNATLAVLGGYKLQGCDT